MSEAIFSPETIETTKQLGQMGGTFAKLGQEALDAMKRNREAEALEASLPPLATPYRMRPKGNSQVKPKLFPCHLCDDWGAVLVTMEVETAWGVKRYPVAFGCDCGRGGQLTSYLDHFGMLYRNSPDCPPDRRAARGVSA